MRHYPVIVVLEVMWGDPEDEAPNFFWINTSWNHTGIRLAQMIGDRHVYVTNACRECVASPNHRGTPDPVRLQRNLESVSFDVLLICGKVAQETYEASDYELPTGCKAYYMKHPAARNWKRREIEEVREQLENDLQHSRHTR